MRGVDHVRVSVQTGDVFEIEGDVLALKFEEDPVGIERALLARLKHGGSRADPAVPGPGEALLLETAGATRAPVSLLLGIRPACSATGTSGGSPAPCSRRLPSPSPTPAISS